MGAYKWVRCSLMGAGVEESFSAWRLPPTGSPLGGRGQGKADWLGTEGQVQKVTYGLESYFPSRLYSEGIWGSTGGLLRNRMKSVCLGRLLSLSVTGTHLYVSSTIHAPSLFADLS